MKGYQYLQLILCVSLLCCGCGSGQKNTRTDAASAQSAAGTDMSAAQSAAGSDTALSESAAGTDMSAGQRQAEDSDGELAFCYPAIEEKTREILGKPEGAVTKEDVLTITEFVLDGADCARPFQDLQWFQNLEQVELYNCSMESLDGVERLSALRVLKAYGNELVDIAPVGGLTGLTELRVGGNAIGDITPVSGLTNLTKFSCDHNPVSDYTPLRALASLEELEIGANNSSDTDLGAVAGLTRLTRLYAPSCGISDISALKNLTQLEYLNLYHNRIGDVRALEDLAKLRHLYLDKNEIADITPLYGLDSLEHIDLDNNNIPDEEFARFFREKRTTDCTVEHKGRLREDMAEFTFLLTADYNLQTETYELQTLEVYEGDTRLQTVSIPEMTCFGQTAIWDSMADTLGFTLEDLNFDGYQDIRLYDTQNGNYRVESIYLVWNPVSRQFEQDARLNAISLAAFDQEKKLIYGMERGGAACHYYSTYQYIDGEPVKIRYEEEEGVYFGDVLSAEFRIAASGKEEAASYEGVWMYVHVLERSQDTGELETVSEAYVFSQLGEDGREAGRFSVDTASKLGQRMKEAEQ